MLVSYKVLNKYVSLDNIDPYKLGEILTNSGLEVEEVIPYAQGSDLVIGYVIDVIKHPKSDKLSICQVDIKSEVLQIVCGAPNVRSNINVIVAKPGCKLDFAKVPLIKKVTIAGIESNGMICSLAEIGINAKYLTESQLNGIEILSDELEIGAEALTALGFDDYILDISLTPNRSDIYSIYALAIEVSCLLKKDYNDIDLNVNCSKKSVYDIVINDEACISYGLFTIDNLSCEDSAFETKNHLIALGYKPRFNIVDEANLAMVVSGNPLHTFDADKLKSKSFIIQKGIECDDFLALDDKIYQINKEDLVIMNGDDIVCIAGVIGSKSSCIDENTRNIVVEGAVFDHVSVRNTARRLDLFSEASIRFSKIVNPYTLEMSIMYLTNALKKPVSSINKVNYMEYVSNVIVVTIDKIKRVLGIDISIDECEMILLSLSFKVEKENNILRVWPHSYRKDVTIDYDVIEEIIRIYGYDNIVTSLPVQEIIYNEMTSLQQLTNDTKNIFTKLGLNEIITYQLSSKDKLDVFSDNYEYKELSYPLSEERKYFRNQLLSSMVEVISFNKSYQNNDLSLFEVSNVYLNGVEQRFLSLGLTGIFENNSWQQSITKVDFYLLKGLIFNYLESLGYHYGRFLIKEVESNHAYMHPTKSAYITLNNNIIGVFGEIHPIIAQNNKLKNCYVASINLTDLSKNIGKQNTFQKLSVFPGVTRDLSLVVKNNIKANEIIKVVKTGNSKLVKEVTIFDLYRGDNIEDGYYSLSLSIKIQDEKQTLNDDMITNLTDTIINNLKTKLEIVLRK